MLGITKYFTQDLNTVGGIKKSLAFMPLEDEDLIKDLNEQLDLSKSPTPKLMRLQELDKIAFEKCDSPKASAIMITFKESYRKHYTDYQIKKILSKLLVLAKLEYILYPEYGDNNNLHYHGVIWGTKMACSELLKELKRYIGISTIRMIRNPEQYRKYIIKERDVLTIPELLQLTIFKIK